MTGLPAAVTVVVPTYRRPESLQRLLRSLSEQAAAFEWDAVVVDNDKAGSARDVVHAAARTGLAVRYEQEPRTGVAHARNRGVAAAAGDVLAFLDDDVVPLPGWLAAVCAPVVAGQAVAAGGPVILDPEVPRPRWFDESGIGGYLSSFSLGDEPLVLDDDGQYLLTANFAVARADLLGVGGFDPAFGPRGGTQLVADDARLVRLLRRNRGTVIYAQTARVVHELPPQRLTRRYLLTRAYQQGRSDWLLERMDHLDRRIGGARVAFTVLARWTRHELGCRWAEGLGRREVRFHVACDAARVVGFARGVVQFSAASHAGGGRPSLGG
jgi:glycosyltransferase involved in cell wall biosynthesis